MHDGQHLWVKSEEKHKHHSQTVGTMIVPAYTALKEAFSS